MQNFNIVLIGFMGTGKSAVARYLEQEYGMESAEMDQIIAEREGKSIPEIFSEYGEEYFRSLETRLLREFKGRKQIVISCGGGVPMRAENAAELKKIGKSVLLIASPETVYRRVRNSHDRPVLSGRGSVEGIAELMEERREKYKAAADYVIDTENKTIPEVCRELMEKVSGIGELSDV